MEDLVIVGLKPRLSAAKIPIAGASAFAYSIIITDACPFVKQDANPGANPGVVEVPTAVPLSLLQRCLGPAFWVPRSA